MQPSLEDFSAALRELYAAASDPRLWPSALAAIEQVTDCAGVEVNILARRPATNLRVLIGERLSTKVDADLLKEWIDHLAMQCPRMGAEAANPQAPYLCDYMELNETEMNRDAVYDWYTRADIRYFIGSGLVDTPNLCVNWALERSNRQGHAQQSDLDLFLLLKPHVRRAFELAAQIGSLTATQPAVTGLVETAPQAVFALGRSGAIVVANRRAEQMLTRGGGFSSAGGVLAAIVPDDDRALQRLIAGAQRGAGGWMRLSRKGGRPALLVSVVPLPRESDHPLAERASVLVFVQNPVERRGVTADALVELFGFTPAEARLASALACGHSLESAAQLLGLSVQTERTYLKSIFRKAEVNRQQDLVRLLSSLPLIESSEPPEA